jgi:hypothetical protein
LAEISINYFPDISVATKTHGLVRYCIFILSFPIDMNEIMVLILTDCQHNEVYSGKYIMNNLLLFTCTVIILLHYTVCQKADDEHSFVGSVGLQ